MLDLGRGATTFLVAGIKKTRAELQGILADPKKLSAAASYHNIPDAWARFWITDELNRNSRRG